jgi:hypothetical protein
LAQFRKTKGSTDWLVKMTMRVPKQDTDIGDLDRLIEQEGRCG